MKIDRKKLIDAGIRYIYQLDDCSITSIERQVSRELDEILELNQPETLKKRLEWIGVGEPADYLNHWLKTDEGYVLAGIRHFCGNKEEPFVYIWPSFKIKDVSALIKSTQPCFGRFSPKRYIFWTRPDCNDYDSPILQQRFFGRISKMRRHLRRHCSNLEKPVTYYEWYRSEYEKFHAAHPEYIDRIPVNSQELMNNCLDEGLLFLLLEGKRKAGLIAGENDTFLDQPAIYLNEILVAEEFRGKGYSKKMLGSFVNLINAEYFICHIDSENIPSTRAALWSGQKVFSQECSITIDGQ